MPAGLVGEEAGVAVAVEVFWVGGVGVEGLGGGEGEGGGKEEEKGGGAREGEGKVHLGAFLGAQGRVAGKGNVCTALKSTGQGK